jgi:hypothetical protein
MQLHPVACHPLNCSLDVHYPEFSQHWQPPPRQAPPLFACHLFIPTSSALVPAVGHATRPCNSLNQLSFADCRQPNAMPNVITALHLTPIILKPSLNHLSELTLSPCHRRSSKLPTVSPTVALPSPTPMTKPPSTLTSEPMPTDARAYPARHLLQRPA